MSKDNIAGASLLSELFQQDLQQPHLPSQLKKTCNTQNLPQWLTIVIMHLNHHKNPSAHKLHKGAYKKFCFSLKFIKGNTILVY